MNIKYAFIFGCLLQLCSVESYSQEIESIQLDRPDQTESVSTVPKNHFQMENGFLFEHFKNDIKSTAYPASLIKYGLTDNFELGVIVELNTIEAGTEKSTGINPITLRFKETITEEKGLLPAISFIGYLGVPTLASKDFKTTYYAPAFRFTLQNTLSDKLTLGYNLGAEWDGFSPEPVFIYTLALGYSVSEKIGIYGEIYGYAHQESTSDHRIDGGITYLLKSNIIIDFSRGTGISSNSSLLYYWSLGFSFRLKD
jgi:hypothetical protein